MASRQDVSIVGTVLDLFVLQVILQVTDCCAFHRSHPQLWVVSYLQVEPDGHQVHGL